MAGSSEVQQKLRLLTRFSRLSQKVESGLRRVRFNISQIVAYGCIYG